MATLVGDFVKVGGRLACPKQQLTCGGILAAGTRRQHVAEMRISKGW